MPRKLSWWQGGLLIAILVLFTFSVFGANKPFGCSTSIPFFSSIVFDLEDYEYAKKVISSGSWQTVMLTGAFIGGLLTSIFITKSFSFKFMPSLWKQKRGNSIIGRTFWSFIAGFMMVFGARFAGGCTSGHMLSGIPQTALSGFIFAIFVITSLLITARIFYKKD
jgi:hypothetical protein